MNAIVSSDAHKKLSNEYTPDDAEVFENVELHVARCVWLLRKQ